MHKSVLLSIFIIALASCGRTGPADSSKTNTAGANETLLADRDGNQYPVKVLADNNLWMTANLNVNIPDSYCYDNNEKNCERYGRLYTWEAAQRGCALLGGDWRLPSDSEWRQLATLYGGIPGDSVATRRNAYRTLMLTGNTEFNATLGGGRNLQGDYRRIEAHGFYWTATESDSLTAWFANFAKGSQSLYHQNGGEKTHAFSVRCIKGMDTSP